MQEVSGPPVERLLLKARPHMQAARSREFALVVCMFIVCCSAWKIKLYYIYSFVVYSYGLDSFVTSVTSSISIANMVP